VRCLKIYSSSHGSPPIVKVDLNNIQVEFKGARQIATGKVVYSGFPVPAVKVAGIKRQNLLFQKYFPKLYEAFIFGMFKTNYIV